MCFGALDAGVCVCLHLHEMVMRVQEWGLFERGCPRSMCVGGVQEVWVLGGVQEWGLSERGCARRMVVGGVQEVWVLGVYKNGGWGVCVCKNGG
jgi:hypothetical protein